MVTFSIGSLMCVAFVFFWRTVASADVVDDDGPEKGRLLRLSTYFNRQLPDMLDGGADLLSILNNNF
jgi:hypothetical protein